MVAEREHAMLMQFVGAKGSFFAAALDGLQIFGYYFRAHLLDAGENVYPYGYGAEGAFLVASAGHYGWWHDPDTGVTYTSDGTDTNDAVVFGIDEARLTAIHSQALADGVNVLRCVRVDTNEVV